MDREKVIKGLECCRDRIKDDLSQTDEPCNSCPYAVNGNVCSPWELYDDAISLLKEDCHNCKLECLLQKYDELKEKYDKLLKEQEADKWIPVSERLPKNMANKVLVYLQHEDLVDQIGYGHYEKFHGEEMWFDLENNEQFSKRGYTVTHWMPLPKSPKGERLALS